MDVKGEDSQQMEVVISLPDKECLLTDMETEKDLKTELKDCSEGLEEQNIENSLSVQTNIQVGSEK